MCRGLGADCRSPLDVRGILRAGNRQRERSDCEKGERGALVLQYRLNLRLHILPLAQGVSPQAKHFLASLTGSEPRTPLVWQHMYVDIHPRVVRGEYFPPYMPTTSL